MKKTYITPIIEISAMTADDLLIVASQGVVSNDYDIDYGGIEDGTKVPGSRQFSVLDDEEDGF